MTDAELPLKYLTPASWAGSVLSRPLELLNDHAHLEKKAAANALELLNRWPEASPPENWVVVDPPNQTIEVHRTGREILRYTGADALGDEPNLPGFSLQISEIFGG